MDAFLDYEEQLKELCVSLRKHAEVIPTAKGDAKRKAIATARDELDEAAEVLVRQKKKKIKFISKIDFCFFSRSNR
jgi:hypothetical protein